MNQEELKTCLGQLMLDLRANWAYDYEERLHAAKELCNLIEDDTSRIESLIDEQLEDDWRDGRVFRNEQFYGYSSVVNDTVVKYLRDTLSHPDMCSLLDNL